MTRGANVTSIDTVRDFRAALCEFSKDAKDSLCAADLHIRRTFDWLNQMQKHWQKEIRTRHEEMLRAKSELLRRKEMKRQGIAPGTADQEKALHKAQARLKEAEEKVANCRRWVPLLQHAVNEYQGPARALSGVLDAELVQGLALLDRKLDALEAYLAVAVPSAAAGPGGGPSPDAPAAAATPAPEPPAEVPATSEAAAAAAPEASADPVRP